MGLPNPWVLLGGVVGIILLTSGSYFYGKHVGVADRVAVEDHQNLANANNVINKLYGLGKIADKFGAKNETDQQNIQQVADTVRQEIDKRIKPDRDPYVTCGFVRLHDGAVTGQVDDRECAGKSDDALSDVRVSEVLHKLDYNYNNVCKANAKQLDNLNDFIREFNKSLAEKATITAQ